MDQGELTGTYCARPQNFAWFLGAGASRTAGLPTASDIIWDLKRRHYCQKENQEISRQDIQNYAVRKRIQDYMESKGFPAQWADNEYTTYFEKIFGDDKERQRRYLKAILSEDKIALSIGNRVIGALISSQLCRVAFTTNFDSVVEKAVAEVGGQSLSAYHLEGSHSAKQALDNEEYPIYCKLHGDFRYDSLKNLPDDLAEQNSALAECLVNTGNRFGFIVSGYSGRDDSVISLFRTVLETTNPFPHGLFWTGIKGSAVYPAVNDFLDQAREKGVQAEYVQIETFDALLLRLWRNIDSKPPQMDAQVRKTQVASVNIPLPRGGRGKPIVRFNALPVLEIPNQCLALSFSEPKDWDDLRKVRNEAKGKLIFTKSDSIWCWGARNLLQKSFEKQLKSAQPFDLPTQLELPKNLHFKGFIEEALCTALARGKPLLCRTTRLSAFLITDPDADDKSALQPLSEIVGNTSGLIPNLLTTATEQHPLPQPVRWSEAIQVSFDIKDGRMWLLIDPDLWVWPPQARRSAVSFLDGLRGDRYNIKYNSLLDAWARVILGTDERNTEISLSAFAQGDSSENPSFKIGSRTGFSWRLVS